MALKSKKGGRKMDWLTLAIASMVFLSISNLFLKMVASNPAFEKLNLGDFLLPGAIVAIGIIIALVVFSQKTTQQIAYLPVGIVVFATLGVIAMIFAFKTGKVAVVTAVLSLSTVHVAGLSFFLLGDRFTGREIAAMVLAIMSLLVLII